MKREEILRLLRSKNYDIYLLNETHSTPEIGNKWEKKWGGKCYSHKNSQS